MKKTISYFLLCLFLFNTCGFYAAYLLLHQQNKKDFIAAVQKNNFSSFKKIILSDTEMKNENVFQKKDKYEFVYKGKMYDVVRQNKTANGICFYCYDDEKDSFLTSALEKNVDNFVHSDNKNNTQKNNFLNSFFSKLYCANHVDFNPFISKNIRTKKIFFQSEYQSPQGKVSVPPPKFIFA